MKKIFISYSHKDVEWKDRLTIHLRVLARQGFLEIWDDHKIRLGDNWLEEIENALDQAAAAILLITADFLDSDFILDREIPALLKRKENDGLTIIPLFVKACPWKDVGWLNEIQGWPEDGNPLEPMTSAEVNATLSELVSKVVELIKPAHGTGTTGSSSIGDQYKPPEKILIAKLPGSGKELFGREQELVVLDNAWEGAKTNIISLVAWGGVGKSALVKRWLNVIAKENFRGANLVYGWSFYSQGSSEDRQASSDEFLFHALRWFGGEDEDPSKGGPWDKAMRLVQLIRKKRTLLILDGLEPLQYPTEVSDLSPHESLKDQGMKALLRELAMFNPGLCIITTRVRVKELDDSDGISVKRVPLENLSDEAGGRLLVKLGVNSGLNEARKAAAEFGGHALTLNLLGSYISTVHDGDIRKRDAIPKLTEDANAGGHARRVMRSYELWFSGKPELSILYIMGLFDRPVRSGAIDALKAGAPINGLTEELQSLSKAEWRFALKNLRELRLLDESFIENQGDMEEILDCHPLIREYFGDRLKTKNPDAWKVAHSRLYDYFKNLPEKELPDTIEEMEPLFAAVAHGCRSGRRQEAWEDVYFERIRRKNEAYSVHQLGAIGADLTALSSFFESLWDRPVLELNDHRKAVALAWVGFGLRALGRLREAAQPMKAAMDAFIVEKDWKNASISAGNLSELYLTMGDVKKGVDYARLSVKFADRSEVAFQMEGKRTTLANALHQRGDRDEAERLFQEAEAMQKKSQPEYPYLYSLQGFLYCDLLLSRGEYSDSINREEQALRISQLNSWLLDIAIDNLTLGRAHFLKSVKEKSDDFTKSETYLNKAVNGLRKSGDQDVLPHGLISRATLNRRLNNFEEARRDLTEAHNIAESGGMRLHLIDYHLESARLFLAEKDRDKALPHFTTAKKMIDETDFHRQDEEIKELESALA